MDNIRNIAGRITGIYTEKIILNEKFIDFAARFADMPGTVVLMSGGDLDSARYHILAAKPWLTCSGFRDEIAIMIGEHTFKINADPFDTLRKLINTFTQDTKKFGNADLPEPISAGLFGYLSYDLKDCIENLPRTSIDNLHLPLICFYAPSVIVIHDKRYKSTTLCIPKRKVSGKDNVYYDIDFFKNIMSADPPSNRGFCGTGNRFSSNFNKQDYLNTIETIKEYIASGHVYQVNLSQRFEADFSGNAYCLFKTLYKKNPAPFFSYINTGTYQIVSTSPERFLKQRGNLIETRPIKGTRPRGEDKDLDDKLKNELQTSKKDDAELSMIVDLLRNDLGKVCATGSVKVTRHKIIESYENVYHLVSVVEGKLDKGKGSVDLISATFPGGSITGCPKIRAMEIIDELEPHRRHIYTGSIGYIGFNDSMDLSIAIRTATIINGKIIFSVGGGIVYDSDPLEEYNETIHKGKTFLEVFKEKGKKVCKNYVWLNGKIRPSDQAKVPVTDQGLLFGYGFFETIQADKGSPKYLNEHIERFNLAWKRLFESNPPDLTWNDIIGKVIAQNGLENKTAAVKILATKGDREKPPFNHTLLVMARQYTHRLEGKKEPGINLALFPEPRQTPLADHKTLNYLYYLQAGKWAASNNADEALILNPDGTVSETNTANIMLIRDKKIILPKSYHVLPGIMQKIILRLLKKLGYQKVTKKIFPKDLFSGGDVIISNSLIGAVPVISIDNKKLPKPSGISQMINHKVL